MEGVRIGAVPWGNKTINFCGKFEIGSSRDENPTRLFRMPPVETLKGIWTYTCYSVRPETE
eukprot:629978-Amphidinium_carterae.1